jgi:hypothetical protein
MNDSRTPGRGADELLELVYARAGAYRRRRRLQAALAAAVVLSVGAATFAEVSLTTKTRTGLQVAGQPGRAASGTLSAGPPGHLPAPVTGAGAAQAIDAARRRRRGLPGRAAPDPSDPVAVRITVAQALRGLPRRQRDVVVLRHLVGLSEAEVAGTLGQSQNSVKTHGARGMAKLRQRLGPLRFEL